MDRKKNVMAEKILNNIEEPKLPMGFEDARRNHGGQTVPDDFFAQFEKKMNAVIDADILLKEAEKKAQQPQIQWYQQHRTWMSIAACALLIVIVGVGFHLDRFGHMLSDAVSTDMVTAQQDNTSDELNEIELPEMVEESYICTTNDYELYEYFCDML